MSKISLDSYGTSKDVTEIRSNREVKWGGFHAILAADQNGEDFEFATIYLSAIAWTGHQPRLAIGYNSPGYFDWRQLLDAAPAMPQVYRFVGSADARNDPESQWVTRGNSLVILHAGK